MTTPSPHSISPTGKAYAQSVGPDKHEPAPGMGRSTFSRLRLHIDAQEMVCDWRVRTLDPTATAIFWRLLPYAVYGDGVPVDVKALSRFVAPISGRALRKAWPSLEPLFLRQGDSWLLRECDWLSVELKTAGFDRVPLRHLLEKLMQFWGAACVYCGSDAFPLHIEHIIPKARGGGDRLENLTLACQSCNSRKATKTAAEFGYPEIHERAAGIH